RLSAGTLGQFVLYALIGGGSVGALAEVWNELQRAAGGMGRIGELLQEDIEIRAPAQPQALPQPLRGEIQFDDVVFHYPQRPDQAALDHFT
ncbi:ABC transporter, partial [Guyparkeria sp. 1SP6A2]|nr:ABC transporter [Guyparkeria sp. 1SP6A2]